MFNYSAILNEIYTTIINTKNTGKVATYIPELAHINPNKFGMYLLTHHKESFGVGDFEEQFSIQSIAKVLSFSLAFSLVGDSIWERVDVEPSGSAFNELSLIENEQGIPRNPLINAGSFIIADILLSKLKNPKEDFLNYVRALANDDSIFIDEKVAESERKTGFKNYAAANLLKSFNNLNHTVDEVLDFYFHQSAISMNCQQLSNAFYIFANHGCCIKGVQRLTINQTKRINAIMLTCGFYDEAGEFAFRVGLPGKSGVGGGIVAILPNSFVVSTWSPSLNPKGNSALGMQALELFTFKTSQSIF